MDEEKAKIHISLEEGIIEISGSETFVTQQIESFKELIQNKFKQSKAQTSLTQTGSSSSSEDGNNISSFKNVLGESNGKIQILKRIPGKSQRAREINTAIVYLWAKATLGKETVPFKEIQDVCRQQSCLDKNHFSTHMKLAKSDMIVEGSAKSQTAKLTIPGKEKAFKLLQTLENPSVEKS